SPEPTPYGDNTFVCVLDRTADFNLFLKRRSIKTEQAFFTAEFMYPVEPAAALCLELVSTARALDIGDWKAQINGDYWPSVGQKIYNELVSAQPGSADWFYARGVPDFLKSQFAESASDRAFDTAHLDAFVTKATRVLLEEPATVEPHDVNYIADENSYS
ncbi:hypothetical protein, partial [Xanthobacter sediminis]|uniref:hypothetical protein n=1 Tax=Xanthobacter sediminis TaxID=3119926 RepID=UPI003726FAB9